MLSTGQLVTEEFYALGKLVRLGLGLAPLRRQHHAVHGLGGVRLQAGLRQRRAARLLRRLRATADVVVLFGANVADNHPLLAPRLHGPRPARRLIVVDPRVTKTAMIADLHLPVRPRTDITLINGLLHVLFAEGLVDRALPGRPHRRRRRARGPRRRLRPRAGRRRVRHRRSRTCVGPPAPSAPPSAASSPGRWASTTRCRAPRRVALLCTPGRRHRQHRPARRRAVLDHRPVQRDGHPGGGLHRLDARLPRLRRPRRPGRAGRAVGHRRADDLPTERGRAYPDIINAVDEPARSRASGSSAPTRSCRSPTARCSSTRFDRLDLLVVQDGFETPDHRARRRRAPRRHLGREGGHVHQLRAAGVAGAGRGRAARARPDPTSTSSSAWPSASGCATALFPGWTEPRRRVRRVAPGLRRPPLRLQRHHLRADRRRRRRAVAVPRPTTPTCRSAGHPASTPTAASPTRPGKVRLHVRRPPGAARTSPGRSSRSCSTPAARSSTGTPAPRPAGSRSSSGLAPEAWVEINPADADALGVRTGDLVRVTLVPRARSTRIVARVTADRAGRRGVHPVPLRRGLRQPAHASTSSTRSPASRTTSSAPCGRAPEPAPSTQRVTRNTWATWPAAGSSRT